jgi:hypothetical protein
MMCCYLNVQFQGQSVNSATLLKRSWSPLHNFSLLPLCAILLSILAVAGYLRINPTFIPVLFILGVVVENEY